jgi:replicative DNA helicase
MKRDPLVPMEAEAAVLGAILADCSLLAVVAEVVTPQDFGSAPHEAIFAAMLALDQAQRPLDHLTISEHLKEKQQLVAAGGPAYLMSLDQGVPLTHNAPEYARVVKAHATRRRFASAAQEVRDAAVTGSIEAEHLHDYADKRILSLRDERRSGEMVPLCDLIYPTLDALDRARQASAGGVTGLPTGFLDLDKALTGLHPGELIVLAARPGLGKTSLAMNVALHVATKGEKAVGVFSLEMPAEQLLLRMLASHARVDLKKLRGGRLTPYDESRFQEAAGAVAEAPVYIDDSGDMSPLDVRAKARRLKQKDPRLALIVVDYLQLMRQRGKTESRQAEVSEISRSLKQLAKEVGVPVLALSQLNRKVEERKGGRPMLSDLRESGAIEQDADVVLFIHHEAPEDGEGKDAESADKPIPVEIVIAKQRNGPIGDVPLVFNAAHTRFENRMRGEWTP